MALDWYWEHLRCRSCNELDSIKFPSRFHYFNQGIYGTASVTPWGSWCIRCRGYTLYHDLEEYEK